MVVLWDYNLFTSNTKVGDCRVLAAEHDSSVHIPWQSMLTYSTFPAGAGTIYRLIQSTGQKNATGTCKARSFQRLDFTFNTFHATNEIHRLEAGSSSLHIFREWHYPAISWHVKEQSAAAVLNLVRPRATSTLSYNSRVAINEDNWLKCQGKQVHMLHAFYLIWWFAIFIN
jgi:hypothetical protein